MSAKQTKKSTVESDPQENDSVFDFLYHDPQRIGSFLGQFDPYGVAQSHKRVDQTSKSSTEQANDALKVNAGFVSGQIGDRSSQVQGTLHNSERTYDPLWVNARAFLDYLQQRDMVERDIDQARIGQFVLFTGALSIADLTLVKEAWKLPALQMVLGVAPAEPVSKHANSAARKRSAQPDSNAFALEMLGILPHSIQATIASNGQQVWSTLKAHCLATEPSDLTLKHGFRIPGDWSVVGILDAQPSEADADFPDEETGDDGTQAVNVIFQSLAPVTRNIMGRPPTAFGVTPLLIFREVRGKTL